MTIGKRAAPAPSSAPLGQVQTFFNTALPEKGANLVSPVSGTIVRWRMAEGVGGPFYLRVLRPNGSGAYAGAGTSGPATPTEPWLADLHRQHPDPRRRPDRHRPHQRR